jgi:hypothetical protein
MRRRICFDLQTFSSSSEAATLILAIYRRIPATHQEEDTIHPAAGDEGQIAKRRHCVTAINHWALP